MVHACRIKGGKAAYSNRWVDTARLRQEREAGYAHCLKVGHCSSVGAHRQPLCLARALRFARVLRP